MRTSMGGCLKRRRRLVEKFESSERKQNRSERGTRFIGITHGREKNNTLNDFSIARNLRKGRHGKIRLKRTHRWVLSVKSEVTDGSKIEINTDLRSEKEVNGKKRGFDGRNEEKRYFSLSVP